MPGYATSIDQLREQIQEAIDKLAKELQKIDEKITPVVERAEAEHPDDGLFRANMELKASYIEQGKQAISIQVLVSIQELIAASLELEVKQAQANADADAAAAAAEKDRNAAEKKAKQAEADAAAARAKAEADADAAKAKAEAEREEAQKNFDAAQHANASKKNAAMKKAEQDAIKAIIAALNAAAEAFKKSAGMTAEVKKMKDDLEKEIDERTPVND